MLKKSKFGAAVLKAIQLQLSTEGTKVEEIQQFLTEMRDTNVQKQAEDDTIHGEEIIAFDAKIEELTNTIETLKSELIQLNNDLDTAKNDLTSEINLKESKTNERDSLQAALDEYTARREAEKAAWEFTAGELEICLDVANKIREKIKEKIDIHDKLDERMEDTKGKAEVNFELVELTKKLKKNTKHSLLIEMMLETQGFGDKLLTFFSDIVDTLQKNYDDGNALEVSRAADYEAYYNENTDKINVLNGEISAAAAKIANLESFIATTEQTIQFKTESKARNEDDLATTYNEKQTEIARYEKATAERTEEYDIVNILIDIFAKKFEKVRDYISLLQL